MELCEVGYNVSGLCTVFVVWFTRLANMTLQFYVV